MPVHTVAAMVTRFRVFRAVHAIMVGEGRCPTGAEISGQLGISRSHVNEHLAALRHANGLPLPIPAGRARRGRYRWSDDRSSALGMHAAAVSNAAHGYRFDENYLELDELFQLWI